MTLLNIIKFPNKKLLYKAKPVNKITKNTIDIINNMFETMIYNNGIGLAATQVDIHQQIIVINIIKDNNLTPLVIINPNILNSSKETVISKEGCLSFPDIYINVRRQKIIKIKFIDINANIHILKANNLLSICLQHEIDHLKGITLYNKMSNLKKKLFF